MASAMRVFRKFRASDGRIKVGTASGLLAVVAALALLMALPVSATHVEPDLEEGNPSCSDVLGENDYLFEHKIDDPKTTPEDDPIELDYETSEGEILEGHLRITVHDDPSVGETFDFLFSGDFDAAGVIVKGGDSANFYDYTGMSGVTEDEGLHAPEAPSGKFHDLSHISFCVGEGPNFICDDPQTLNDEDGPIVEVTAEIFANSLYEECFDKDATFANDGDTVTLAFEGDGSLTAAGRLDFTKEFGSPPDFEPLEYDPDSDGENFVDVVWCNIRDAAVGDGDQFEDVLGTTELYPSLLDDNGNPLQDGTDEDATACKVYEEEIATGFQFTVVYFEFEDPQFR